MWPISPIWMRDRVEEGLECYDDHSELIETLRVQHAAGLASMRDESRATESMQIPCDQHVAPRDVQGFEPEPRLTVTTVAEGVANDAPDSAIRSLAHFDDWVVLTNDRGFYRLDGEQGLPVYSRLEDPSPGAAVEAIGTLTRPRPRLTTVVKTFQVD